MRLRLPKADEFAAFTVVRLDDQGRLLADGVPVAPAHVRKQLKSQLRVPPLATDIFVFVHGWQHDQETASAAARRLFSAVWTIRQSQETRYPALRGFLPYFVSVQWPSRSSPFPRGYRRIRDRAHAMTTHGHASHVLAALLGYLEQTRQRWRTGDTLRTSTGKYLHCVGHSFGCRMLGEAIKTAAQPPEDPTLGWPFPRNFPFAVDTFLGFQMAAPPDIFTGRFLPLVEHKAPISGPIVLTFSPYDRALSTWHRFPEGMPGLGAVGAVGASTIKLHPLDSDYTADEFTKLTNVNAKWLYRRGSFSMQGAHSDFWHPESIHLLLSLASLSRQ